MAEAQLELKQASTVVDNKKVFLKYINSKRKTKENTGPILDEARCHLTNRNEDEAETFNATFASVFSTSGGPWDLWSPGLEDHDWGVIDSHSSLNLYRICCCN